MKTKSLSPKGRARLTAARDTRGTKAVKGPRVAAKRPAYEEPSVCERCGASFVRKTWRHDHRVTHDMLTLVAWVTCPACRQKRSGIAYGRVIVRGLGDARRAAAIARRIRAVAARAAFTQPQRTILSLDPVEDGLEVLTTSQKLAHRIVHELKKAFGGRARYRWSDRDGALYATWSAGGASSDSRR